MTATVEVAVPGRVPDPMKGIRFRSRPYSRREHHLSAVEVAVLEVLREPRAAEVTLAEVADRVRELILAGRIRLDVLAAAIADEPRVGVRSRWAAIAA